jgi:DNA (cytosine-5)-methyltransferase 1
LSIAYYNEIDPYAAEWLRTLILVGLIAPGEVDERSIEDVTPGDLAGYTQCHFFAGIGGWSLALRLAGWPDERPVWTGSCPCQPFSAAGKGAGVADERHLWPAWQWLIGQCRPVVVFGEQVEAAVKHDWLDLVQTDLEGLGYVSGAVCLPAAGVGAPHARSRLWFVADTNGGYARAEGVQRSGQHGLVPSDGRACELANNEARRRSEVNPVGGGRDEGVRAQGGQRPDRGGVSGELGNPDDERPQGRRLGGNGTSQRAIRAAGMAGGSLVDASGKQVGVSRCPREQRSSYWADVDWIPCRDGKARPVEPGTFPLAHGVPARVGRLRAYGNAIVPQVAAEVIRAYGEWLNR